MKEKYVKPNIDMIGEVSLSMLASSSTAYLCTERCKFWHICRDRVYKKVCEDFEFK